MNPRLIVCYICGREYGSLSIEIHIPKCLEKWKVTNAGLPKNQRKPEPKRPQLAPDIPIKSGQATQALNQAAFESAANAQLVSCENCKRRMLPVQLPRHQKACRPGVNTFKRKTSLKLPFKPTKFRRLTLSARLRMGKTVALLPEVKAKKKIMTKSGQLKPVLKQELKTRSDRVKDAAPKAIGVLPNRGILTVGSTASSSRPKAIPQIKVGQVPQQSSLQPKPQTQPNTAVMQDASSAEGATSRAVQCQRCGLRMLSEKLTSHMQNCKGVR